MNDDAKIVLVFAGSKLIFDNWAAKYFSFDNIGVATNNYILSFRRGKKYKYVCVGSLICVRGISDAEIMLLHGWDHTHRKEKISIINSLIWAGSDVIGDESQIHENDWNQFRYLRNERIFRLRHEFYQDWLFDNILNRFSLMEIADATTNK